MRVEKLRRLLLVCLVLLAFWLAANPAPFLRATPAGPRTEIAVIVHPATPVENLTLAEVRKIFVGERQFWTSNLRLVLVVRAPVARERQVLLDTIYQMSEAQYRQFWISKIFRAEATSGPKVVYSNEMTTELVSAVPGSIALIDASQVPAGVKTVKVNGLLPGQKGYPLR